MRNSFKKAVLLFLSFIITAASLAQTTSKEWFDKAEKLYEDEKYKEAAVAYDKASALDAKNETAFYKAGWCYNDMENFTTAIDRLKDAVALKADDHQAWQELGYAYKKTAKNDKAISALNIAIKISPTYATAYNQLGDVYQKMEKNTEAIAAYEKCYENDSESDDACYNLGYIYNGLDDYDKALQWLNKAIEIKKSVDVYNEIGFANYKLNKNEEAINAYKNALEINEKNSAAYKGLGDTYRIKYSPAKVEDAMVNYLKAIEYNPESAGSHYGLGWCYNEKDRYAEAIPLLAKSIDLDKTFTASYVELGYAQYMTAKYTEGLNTLTQGLMQDSKSILCRYYSGLIYVAQGDKSSATIMYNQLKPLDVKLADKLLAKINAL